jgi:hypothetical protein
MTGRGRGPNAATIVAGLRDNVTTHRRTPVGYEFKTRREVAAGGVLPSRRLASTCRAICAQPEFRAGPTARS